MTPEQRTVWDNRIAYLKRWTVEPNDDPNKWHDAVLAAGAHIKPLEAEVERLKDLIANWYWSDIPSRERLQYEADRIRKERSNDRPN